MEGYYTGRVSSVDREKGFVKVTYPERNNIVSDWLPLLAFEYNMPSIGTLVATVLDKFGNGICLGKLFSYTQNPCVNDGYEKDIDGIKITKRGETFKIKFNEKNYISYNNGTMTIRADHVNIIRNEEA